MSEFLASALNKKISTDITKPVLLLLVLETMFGDCNDSEHQLYRVPKDFQLNSEDDPNSDHESVEREPNFLAQIPTFLPRLQYQLNWQRLG